MVVAPGPILLLPEPSRVGESPVVLPANDANLFQRLIRDPTAPHRPARERLCTELVCGLLQNAPEVRDGILQMLAGLAGVPWEGLAELDWHFRTEGAIGSKRDDLRIEGWSHGNESRRVVLWTIEVKVQSGIHQSSEEDFDDQPEIIVEDEANKRELVSQIQNYDAWLQRQTGKYRAGFVLAITNQQPNLPEQLAMPWHCFTWTQLATQVEQAILDQVIPPQEQLFARHFCGFVRDNLWTDETMSDSRFTFDDLALMRAFAQIGNACFNKIHALVVACWPAVTELVDEQYYAATYHSKTLKGTANRSVLTIKFRPDAKKQPVPPMLYIGVKGGEVGVWLETSPASPEKQAFRKLLKQLQPALLEHSDDWEFSDDEADWNDVMHRRSLEWILTSEDQEGEIQRFVKDVMVQLVKVGFFEKVQPLLHVEEAG